MAVARGKRGRQPVQARADSDSHAARSDVSQLPSFCNECQFKGRMTLTLSASMSGASRDFPLMEVVYATLNPPLQRLHLTPRCRQ